METFTIIVIVLGSMLLLLGLSCYLIGFRTLGVAANSLASCCQSCIGNVVKGSCFAIMTCLAMRGCFILIAVLGLILLASIGIYLMINSEWFESACNWVKNLFHSDATDEIKGFLKW